MNIPDFVNKFSLGYAGRERIKGDIDLSGFCDDITQMPFNQRLLFFQSIHTNAFI